MVDSFNQQNNVGVNVGFQVDKRQARDAATTLNEFNRAVKDVERQRGLSHIARDAAEVVKQTDSARQGAIRLQAELVKVGATQSEVRKVVGEYDRLVQKQQQAAEQARRVAEETKRLNAEFFANLPEPGLDAFFGGKRGGIGGRLGGVSGALRRGGATLFNLPSTPIGDSGLTTDVVGRLARAIGGLPPVTLPAIAAVGGLALVVLELNRRAEEAKKAVQNQIDLEARLLLLRQTGTTEDIESQIEAARKTQQDALNRVDLAQRFVDDFLAGIEDPARREELSRRISEALQEGVTFGLFGVNTLNTDPALLAALETLDKFGPVAEQATQEITLLNGVLNDTTFQSRQLAAAGQEIIEARQKEIDNAQRQRLSLQRSFAGEDNLESLDKRIDALTLEREALADFLQEGNLSAELTQELHQEYVNLNREINILSGNIREEVAVRDAARIAAEDQERTQQAVVDATRSYQEAIADLAEDTANKRIQIEEGYADKITDLTRKYTEDVEKAVVSLQRKQADIALGVNRDIAQSERKAQFDRLQDQIEFGNETAKQSRELERELARIRDDAANNQLDLIRNRDFAGLERLERDRDRALDQAVDNFNVEQREREIAFRQQQELTNQQLEFEAETRRIRFEQQIEDARRAHDRQLADLQQANLRQRQLLAQSRQSELNQLAAAESAKLQLLGQSYSQELRLAAQTAAMRVNLLQQEQQALLSFASAFQGGGGVVNNTSNSRSVSVPISIQSGAGQQQLQQLAPTIQSLVVNTVRQLIN